MGEIYFERESSHKVIIKRDEAKKRRRYNG